VVHLWIQYIVKLTLHFNIFFLKTAEAGAKKYTMGKVEAGKAEEEKAAKEAEANAKEEAKRSAKAKKAQAAKAARAKN
jgi:hypothetical protein